MKADKSTLLSSEKSKNVEQLFKTYKINPYHARVFFMNSNREQFHEFNLWKFEDGDDMDLVYFRTAYGISKTNKIYSHDKTLWRIRIRKDGVWVTTDYKIRQFMLNDQLLMGMRSLHKDLIEKELFERFAWYRFLREEFQSYNRSLNFYIKHKLFNKRAIIKKIYGFEYPLSLVLYDMEKNTLYHHRYNENTGMKNLQHYKPWIINENKLDLDLVKNDWRLFYDTIRMAKVLDKKVNMRWGLSRFKVEHNKMSIEMTNIIYLYDDSELRVKDVYRNYAKEYNRELIDTTKRLAQEGISQFHCVLSYKGDVDRGSCGIYHIDGYTLELKFNNDWTNGLTIGQFRGWDNELAPDALTKEIQEELNAFNLKYYGDPLKRNTDGETEFKMINTKEELIALDEADDFIF